MLLLLHDRRGLLRMLLSKLDQSPLFRRGWHKIEISLRSALFALLPAALLCETRGRSSEAFVTASDSRVI